MNFRVVIAKTARRLGLAWLYTALGWFVLAALTGYWAKRCSLVGFGTIRA